MVLLRVLQDRFPSADNGHALDGTVPFVGVVVDDADRTVTELVAGLHIADDHAARFAGADDHDTSAGLVIASEAGPQEEQEAEEEAQAHDEEHLKHAAPDIVRHGHAAIERRDEDNMENGCRQGGQNGFDQFLDTCIAPHDAVHVEEVENDHREDGVDGDEGGIRIQILRRDGRIVAVEAEPEGQKV